MIWADTTHSANSTAWGFSNKIIGAEKKNV